MCYISLTKAQIATNDSMNTFTLGEVHVNKKLKSNTKNKLSGLELSLHQKTSVADALELLPGVNLTQVGGRNEAMIYVRGYDLRQVPVFVDGMPIYLPYDGYLDLARLQTGGLSKVSVEKGFSSMLYGPNAMGGAINIISMKPQNKLEIRGKAGMYAAAQGYIGHNSQLSIGTRHNKWYAQGDVNLQNIDYQILSLKFDTLSLEQDHQLDNSYTHDRQYRIKFAFTPQSGQEYSLTYTGIRSRKGVPLYLGDDPNARIRYWQYPHWDKDGLFFHSQTLINEKLSLKTRLFYDRYYNLLKSYDDDSYTSQKAKYAFISTYNDHSLGAMAELGSYHLNGHHLKLSLQSKYDHHQEFNADEATRHVKDNTATLALEDSWTVSKHLVVLAGFGYFVRQGIAADDYDSKADSVYSFPLQDDQSLNYQLGLFFKPIDKQQLSLTIARRSRFATMKDRYSYRIGRALPNPDLTSEQSLNMELAWQGQSTQWQWAVSGFYNLLDNTIQQVNDVEPGLYQFQNTGEAEFRGIETSVACQPIDLLTLAASYTFIERRNISQPDIHFIDVPKHKVMGYIKVGKDPMRYLMLDAAWHDERFSTSTGNYSAPAYSLFNLRGAYNPLEHLGLQLGINNLLDRHYAIAEGYPEPGRTFYLSIICDLIPLD